MEGRVDGDVEGSSPVDNDRKRDVSGWRCWRCWRCWGCWGCGDNEAPVTPPGRFTNIASFARSTIVVGLPSGNVICTGGIFEGEAFLYDDS